MQNNKSGKYILFFLWPFGSWVSSVFHPKQKSSITIFFLFSLLICWHMSPPDMFNNDDLAAIIARFDSNSYTFNQIVDEINAYFSASSEAPKELYEHILNWFIKIFTLNYHFFFLVAAIPVAYCQIKVLRKVVDDNRFTESLLGFLIIMLLITPRDIITVQNPRFATGLWLCLYSTICYYYDDGKWKYLFLILISPLIHSGMYLYVALFCISLFVKEKFVRILEILALISIPFTFFDANLFVGINFSFLPPGLQEWAIYYFSDESYAKFVTVEDASGYYWVKVAFELAMKSMIAYMTFTMIRDKRNYPDNKDAVALYPFYLCLFTIVNFIQFVPVLGQRYYWFLRIMFAFVWFKSIYPRHKFLVYLLAATCSFELLIRYGYKWGGALYNTTDLDLFYMPLPYLLGKGLIW